MFRYSDGGTPVPPIAAGESPRYETVQVSIKGSLPALQVMIKTLHKLRYADPNDWSKPQPSQVANQWITVLFRRVRME